MWYQLARSVVRTAMRVQSGNWVVNRHRQRDCPVARLRCTQQMGQQLRNEQPVITDFSHDPELILPTLTR